MFVELLLIAEGKTITVRQDDIIISVAIDIHAVVLKACSSVRSLGQAAMGL